MQKILVVSPLPTHPQDEGANRRVFNMLEVLSNAGNEVHFVHVEQNGGDCAAMSKYWGQHFIRAQYRNPLNALTDFYVRVKSRFNLPHDYPVDAWYDPSLDVLLRQLRDRIDFDVVIVEYVYMSKALEVFGDGVLKIVDTHDVMTDRHRKMMQQGQRPKWFSTCAKEERKALNRADLVFAIQEKEAEFFASLTDKPVVTIGHMTSIYPPQRLRANAATLLFIGTNNSSNVHAIDNFLCGAFPLIRNKIPSVKLLLIGKICSMVGDVDGCEKLGKVASLERFYDEADCVVNPVLFGTGLKIKNVEALGFAKPLVTTSVGAEGMEDGIDTAFLVADTQQAIADAICNVIADEKLYAQLCINGFEYVRRCNEKTSAALLSAVTAGCERVATSERMLCL